MEKKLIQELIDVIGESSISSILNNLPLEQLEEVVQNRKQSEVRPSMKKFLEEKKNVTLQNPLGGKKL